MSNNTEALAVDNKNEKKYLYACHNSNYHSSN